MKYSQYLVAAMKTGKLVLMIMIMYLNTFTTYKIYMALLSYFILHDGWSGHTGIYYTAIH